LSYRRSRLPRHSPGTPAPPAPSGLGPGRSRKPSGRRRTLQGSYRPLSPRRAYYILPPRFPSTAPKARGGARRIPGTPFAPRAPPWAVLSGCWGPVPAFYSVPLNLRPSPSVVLRLSYSVLVFLVAVLRFPPRALYSPF